LELLACISLDDHQMIVHQAANTLHSFSDFVGVQTADNRFHDYFVSRWTV